MPVVATMTEALSESASTMPARKPSPFITDFARVRIFTTSFVLVSYCLKSPVAPAATASMLSWALV